MRVVTLDAPRRIEARLGPDERTALAAIRRRRQLLRAPVWQRHADTVAEITGGIDYGRATTVAARPDKDHLRAAAWNIERGRALEGLLGVLGADEALREVDLLLLNEVDIGMARSGNRDVPRELAEALGFEYVFGNSYLCLDHGDTRDGEQAEENTVGLHGNAILSRYPLRKAANLSLTITRDKFHSSEKRLGHKRALWAEVDTPRGPLGVLCAHLDSIASPVQRAAQLGDALRAAPVAASKRLLVGGDFNTSTYDVKSTGRLLWNVAKKGWRGSFPHAIHHYMHPWELYERPVFDALETAGLDWRTFNDLKAPSIRYEVGDFESESQVSDQLPKFFVRYIARRLRPWNGVAPLRLDWFAARGLRVAGDPGKGAVAKPRWQGQRLSDHDPIWVDVGPATDPG